MRKYTSAQQETAIKTQALDHRWHIKSWIRKDNTEPKLDARSRGQTNQRETGNVGGQTEGKSFGHFVPEPSTLGKDGKWLENKNKGRVGLGQIKERESKKETGLMNDEIK